MAEANGIKAFCIYLNKPKLLQLKGMECDITS